MLETKQFILTKQYIYIHIYTYVHIMYGLCYIDVIYYAMYRRYHNQTKQPTYILYMLWYIINTLHNAISIL